MLDPQPATKVPRQGAGDSLVLSGPGSISTLRIATLTCAVWPIAGAISGPAGTAQGLSSQERSCFLVCSVCSQCVFLANSLQGKPSCPAGLTWGQSRVEGLLAQCRMSHSPASLSLLGWMRTLHPWGRWRLPSRRQMADSENLRVPPPTWLLVL